MAVLYANKNKRGKNKVEESPTKSMRIDIMSVPDGQDVLNKIKGLTRIPEFRDYKGSVGGGLNRDKAIRYIVLLYSKDSIFNERIPIPFAERQMKAYDMAGFDRDKHGELDEDIVKRLLQLNDEDLFEMIFAFMQFQSSHQWREIVTLEHEIEELYKLRMRPIAETSEVKVRGNKTELVAVADKEIIAAQEKKDKLWAGCQNRLKELDALYKTFWGDDEDAMKKSKVKNKISIESWAENNAELGV